MAHQRSGSRLFIIPRWSRNVALMLAQPGCEVWFHCSECKLHQLADLRKLVRFNIALSLWNRRPKCPRCGQAGFFMGHHAPNSAVNPLVSESTAEVDHFHRVAEAYAALENPWRARLFKRGG